MALAQQIAGKTGCKVMGQTYNPKMARGRGRFAIDRIPNVIEQALPILKDFRNIVLVEANDPVAFFAYPNKPSMLKPEELRGASRHRRRRELRRRAGSAAAKELQAIGAPAINDLPVLLDALDAVLKIPSAVHDPVDSPPLSMKLGLYQGDAVDARVSERYRYVLQQALLVRVALHLESVMQSPQAPSEQVYASLKTYLMLFDRERMNHSWFIGVVNDLWRSAYDATAAARARVHLQALAETSDLLVARFHPKNEAIVEAARARVASTSIVDRAYAMLKLSVSTGEGIRLSEVLGPAGVSVMERKTTALSDTISATFTAEGYRKDVKPNIERCSQLLAEEESWVMGGRASGLGRGDLKAISAEIQRRYF